MPALPEGTVTFLFSDVEGSTSLLRQLGQERYAEVLVEYQRLVRESCIIAVGVPRSTRRATRSSSSSRVPVTRSRAPFVRRRQRPRRSVGSRSRAPSPRA